MMTVRPWLQILVNQPYFVAIVAVGMAGANINICVRHR